MNKSIRVFNKVLLVVIILISACGKDDPTPLKYLVTHEEVVSDNADNIKSILTFYGLPELAAKMQYDIVAKRITYNTTYKGETITVSGIVSMPVTEDPVPIASIQHGTIADDASAPTNAIADNLFFTWFASAGYIVVVPDYIGFGESSDVLHPYYHYESSAGAVIDMVRAASELANLEKLNFNQDVFLAGYSEGGYVTMAAHKKMEEVDYAPLNLVASAPAAGGYDIKHVQEYFVALDTYDHPFYMAFVAMSYLDNYDVSTTLSDYFNEPYATKIPSLFDGSKTGSEINAELTTSVPEFLTQSFINDFDTDPTFTEMNSLFEENSLDDWVPQTTMFMYHGTADITVPYENSVLTYNKMIDNGADPNTVEFISIQDATHGSGFTPYILDVIEKFETLK